MFGKKGKVTFDFSDITIKEFIGNIQTTTLHPSLTRYINEHNNNNGGVILKIDFDRSLRLLSIENILLLFKICKSKHIQIIGMTCDPMDDSYDIINNGLDFFVDFNSSNNNINNSSNTSKDVSSVVSNAIEVSGMNGNDIRILSKSRDTFGVPYLSSVLDIQNVFKESKMIFYSLINAGLNVNIIDRNENESVLYKLIKSIDIDTIKYIINCVFKQQNHKIYLNCFNNEKKSPLYYAITNHYKEDKEDKQTNYNSSNSNSDEEEKKNDKNHDEFMYQLITQDPNNLASVNFPCEINGDTVLSPLGCAISRAEFQV